jgi:hypothetical protein
MAPFTTDHRTLINGFQRKKWVIKNK